MGAVNKIPGVSGGTVAFVTGIYEDLINSIKKINFYSFKILFTFENPISPASLADGIIFRVVIP